MISLNSLLSLPNLLSIFRLITAFIIPHYVLKGQWNMAFGLFLMASISDYLDGFIARKFNIESRLGAILDPLADKALMTCSYLVLAYTGDLNCVVTIIVVARDIFILLGVLFLWIKKVQVKFSPLFVSKLNTAMQLFLIVIIMFCKIGEVNYATTIVIVSYVVIFLTILSGVMYLRELYNVLKE